MTRGFWFAAALASLAAAGCARAETLYRQDFQTGAAPEWAATGEGDVRLSLYQDNVSLKVAGHASSRTVVSTKGFRRVIVRSQIAAAGLAGQDGCYAEVSPDGGATWLTALSVRRGQDDAATLISGAFSDPRLDGRASLIVRIRADLSGPAAACWADNIDVSGAAPLAVSTAAPDKATLFGAQPMSGLVAAAAFMPGPGAQPPIARFEGRLELHPAQAPDGLVVINDSHPVAGPDARLIWPDLAIDLAQDQDRLIPAERGPIPSANARWEWIVEPGLVWTDPADGGFSRALLPIALQERNANCIHNGRLTLLFKADGEVSRAAVQFDGEDCAYYRFDAWSLVPAAYRPGPVQGADALIARDRAERAGRPPLKPIEALAADHPGVDLAALSRAAGPSAVFGVFDGTTHYAAPCPTRAGDAPLCAERPLPSYSTAKTLVAAQSLMRLERLRPGTIDEKVADHVPECAAKGGWGDVRLIDLLDMASGHYVSPVGMADEDAPAMLAFFVSNTEAEKLAFVCGAPRKAAPGKTWVYHTADTFLLGAAMTDVWRKAGMGQDTYDDLIRPIWAALGQSADLDGARRTYDAAAQPLTGWGLTFHRDDVIRAARFLGGGAQLGGQPYLDQRLLSEALQRAGPGGGFVSLSPLLRYRHGVWARDVGPLVGCGRPVWTPYLSGYGGISIVLFANGVVFYAFNDEDQFDWGSAVAEVDKIRPLCR